MSEWRIFFPFVRIFCCDFSMFRLCYISPEWAVNGITWSQDGYDVQEGTAGRLVIFTVDLLMTCPVFQVVGPVISISTLDSVPFPLVVPLSYILSRLTLTGQCWQNFSNLRYKSKAKLLHDKWIRTMSCLSLEINAFPFSPDKWGEIRQACIRERDESEFPYVSISAKCCFDICFPPGRWGWRCHRVIRGLSTELSTVSALKADITGS